MRFVGVEQVVPPGLAVGTLDRPPVRQGSGPGSAGRVVAVVPLRDGASGKSRLSSALDPAARRRLVAALARHVVDVLAASDHVARVLVVTADVPFARATLDGLAGPVELVAQPADRPGLNAALDVGRERAVAGGAGRVLVAHADLPLLAADDLAALLAPTDHVVVATDRHGAGTNLLVVPARAGFRFRFGTGSRVAHEAEAARRGLAAAVVRRPGTAVDLDTLDDWGQLPDDARLRLRHAVGASLP